MAAPAISPSDPSIPWQYSVFLQAASRRGDRNEIVNTNEEAEIAGEAYCWNRQWPNHDEYPSCDEFLNYLEKTGFSINRQKIDLNIQISMYAWFIGTEDIMNFSLAVNALRDIAKQHRVSQLLDWQREALSSMLPSLMAVASSPKSYPSVKATALEGLYYLAQIGISSDEAQGAFIDALKSEDQNVQYYGAEGLSEQYLSGFNPQRMITPLIQASSSRFVNTRMVAVWTLTRLLLAPSQIVPDGDKEAIVDVLVEAAGDENQVVRSHAQEGMDGLIFLSSNKKVIAHAVESLITSLGNKKRNSNARAFAASNLELLPGGNVSLNPEQLESIKEALETYKQENQK